MYFICKQQNLIVHNLFSTSLLVLEYIDKPGRVYILLDNINSRDTSYMALFDYLSMLINYCLKKFNMLYL